MVLRAETGQRRSSFEGGKVVEGLLAGTKIAWIDDDNEAISPLLNPLRDEGADVMPYGSIEEALSGLNEIRRSDLIILDLILPTEEEHGETRGRSHVSFLLKEESAEEKYPAGVGLLRRLRKEGVEAPVMVYSVVANEKIHKELRQLGVKSIIVKPEFPEDFCREAERVLDTERLKLRKELVIGILPDAAVGKLKRVATEYTQRQLNILREVDEDSVTNALYAAIISTQKCGEIREFPSGVETSQKIQPEVAERTIKIWNTWLRSQGWIKGGRLPDNFINLLSPFELDVWTEMVEGELKK